MRKLEQTKSNVLSEYSDVFKGLGTFPRTHMIQLKPDALPVLTPPPHRIPVALGDKLEKGSKRVADLGS